MTDRELEAAWYLYRSRRKAKTGWFDDALWTTCVAIAKRACR